MNGRIALVLAFLALPANGQGFAGLGSGAGNFAEPVPGHALSFPRDHGAHTGFRIEWWYVTANLQDEDGNRYGAQWTLFRSALSAAGGNGWDEPQIWMGNAAVTTRVEHLMAQRMARGGIGQAGVTADPFQAWIDEWRIEGETLSDVTITAGGERFAYELRASTSKPEVLHGAQGFSVKSADGSASYYYSQPFYDVEGTLWLADREISVSGSAWFDHEWSSQPLAETQLGWDWVSLRLANGERLMAFQLRETDGGVFSSGTWIDPDGRVTPLGNGTLTMTPLRKARVADRDVPVEWRIELPGRDLDVTISALNPQAWMATLFPYWEGPVTVSGSHEGTGYLEMTGYE